MAIITISRGSYTRGKEIAEQLAQRLGYECISRDSIFDNVNELDARDAKLIHAIEDIPSLFRRFEYGKDSYIAYIQSVLLERLRKDNVVYHGFMGHVFLRDIPNVLKIRIISDIEDRTRIVMERDQVSSAKALKHIIKIDKQREKWSQYLYGIDPANCNQYDLVISVSQIPVATAVDTLVRICSLEQFQTTAESMLALDNLALAAQVRNALLRIQSDIEVSVQDGKVFVKTDAPMRRRSRLVSEIERLSKTIPNVDEVNVRFTVSVPLSAQKVEQDVVIRHH